MHEYCSGDSLVVEGIAPEGNANVGEDMMDTVGAARMVDIGQTVEAGLLELGHRPRGVRDADAEGLVGPGVGWTVKSQVMSLGALDQRLRSETSDVLGPVVMWARPLLVLLSVPDRL